MEGIPKIGMFTLRDVPIIPYMLNLVGGLSSLRPCDQGTSASSSSSKVQSLVHTNRIPLFYQKILARIMLSETKTSRLFIFYCLVLFLLKFGVDSGPSKISSTSIKGSDHGYAHARRLSLQNKFVGSTLNSKSPLPVQSLKILRFIRTSVALAGLVILR